MRALLCLTPGLLCACAQAALPPPALIRADENWYAARHESQLPAYKFLPLGTDDHAFLSLGGELRWRSDSLNAPRYGLGEADDDYSLSRVLVHADLHLNQHARLFMQLGNAQAHGQASPGPTDSNRTDVQNAFLDFKPDEMTSVRLGRQEILLNPAQRFVSVREGPNVRQSFDGLRISWQHEQLQAGAFLTRPVRYEPGSFDDSGNQDQVFHGVYMTRKLAADTSLDIQYLGLRRDQARLAGRQGREDRHSAGLRLSGRHGAWDYDMEGLIQGGHFAGSDIRAWGASLLAGHTFASVWQPRLGVQLDAGSGDDKQTGRLETFNPLFPKGAYFDQSGLNSWANSLIARTSLDLKPHPRLKLQASVSERWRESPSDSVYVQPYAALTATQANHSRRVAQTCQLDASWQLTPNVSLTWQAVHANAGPAITKAGGRDVDFMMGIAQIRF